MERMSLKHRRQAAPISLPPFMRGGTVIQTHQVPILLHVTRHPRHHTILSRTAVLDKSCWHTVMQSVLITYQIVVTYIGGLMNRPMLLSVV